MFIFDSVFPGYISNRSIFLLKNPCVVHSVSIAVKILRWINFMEVEDTAVLLSSWYSVHNTVERRFVWSLIKPVLWRHIHDDRRHKKGILFYSLFNLWCWLLFLLNVKQNGRQEDAHEFFQALVNGSHEEQALLMKHASMLTLFWFLVYNNLYI